MLESKDSISFLPLSCVLMQIVLPLRQWSRSPLNPVKQWHPTVNIFYQRRINEWIRQINVNAYLYCKANHQSNSCPCRSQWPALWGGAPRCCRLRGNWRGPPAAWYEWVGSAGPCSGYLSKQKDHYGMICDICAAKCGVKDHNLWCGNLLNTINLQRDTETSCLLA